MPSTWKAVLGSVKSSVGGTVGEPAALPTPGPYLQSASAGDRTDTTATLTCVSNNTTDGLVYVAARITEAFDANDAQLIIDGVDASFLYAANQAASASISFDATGLTPDTTHYYGFVQDGVIVPLSNVLFSNFPTEPVPIAAPTLSAATAVDKTDTTATLGCTSDNTTNGRVFCAVRITGGAFDDLDAQLILDAVTGVGDIIWAGDVAATAPLTFSAIGLTPEQTHYFGFVQDTDA
jgi:hypothetical protein